jgi:hypothetical protein
MFHCNPKSVVLEKQNFAISLQIQNEAKPLQVFPLNGLILTHIFSNAEVAEVSRVFLF